MPQLPECLQKVGEELVSFCRRGHSGEVPPFLVYVYPPQEEFPVRRDLQSLQRWLDDRGVRSVTLSLADLFWQIVEESGHLEDLFAAEESGAGLAFVHSALRELLAGPPSLADRIWERLRHLPHDASVLLYRTGALFPVYRTSAILDDLRERLVAPVVLLYPGALRGLYGLSFMGRLEPAHGYRAKIVVRGERA